MRLPRLLLAAATLGALAGCGWLPAPVGTSALPRLYVSDVGATARGDAYNGGDQAELETFLERLRNRADFGVFITPSYIFTIDPVLLLQTTSYRTIPATELVSEPRLGSQGTVQVTRNPLYFLDRAVIKYKIPGYTIPDLAITLNQPMKNTSFQLDRMPASYAEPVVRAIIANPSQTPSATGMMEITIEARDMDPFLADGARAFTIVREIPVVYTYNSTILAEIGANGPPIAGPGPMVTPAPSASP